VGENEPVRRYEFELFREELNRWRGRMELRVDDLEDEHDQDMASLATQRSTDLQQASTRREARREWTWGQILTASGVAVALAALWIQAVQR
jgi:hypothetical protein